MVLDAAIAAVISTKRKIVNLNKFNLYFSWECSEAPNVTANVICTACGGAGHIAKDCKNPRSADSAMIDAEVCLIVLY